MNRPGHLRRPRPGRWAAGLVALVMAACAPGAEDAPAADTAPAAEPPPEAAVAPPPPSGEDAVAPAPPTPAPRASEAAAPDPDLLAFAEGADTLEVTIAVRDASCVPGECLCTGSAERSSGLWRVGADLEPSGGGVTCIVGDLDGNEAHDYVVLGGEGKFGAVMFDGRGPYATVRMDGLGWPELYAPRAEPGARGEPVSSAYGIFVPRGGQDAYFVWSGRGFELTVLPAGPG